MVNHGVLLLDKPLGLSSNQALSRAKRLFGVKKAGHTGSLDPLATGMLPCCFGEATKVAGYLLSSQKSYVAEIQFGVTTTTADREGEVIAEHKVPVLTADYLESVLNTFVGTIKQKPPQYSAIKKQGVPLYKLARQGIKIDVPERDVNIFSIILQSIKDQSCEITVTCGSGTYIRSLAVDIGEKIGCGAHLANLRRLWVSPFNNHKMLTLTYLEECRNRGDNLNSYLLPIDSALLHLPVILLSEQQTVHIKNGRLIVIDQDDQVNKTAILYRLYTPENKLLALAEYVNNTYRPKRLFNL